ncbi:MAG: SDR family NAD(P)-dependent oxidoreductase [Thalassobaculaceae bacterium]|nr:SDR family NAD(P)-dependent oxidoreductase [Thalassobaculaceae bacterium]
MSDKVALIIGAGAGLSASLARKFATNGYKVALAARNTDKLSDLTKETGAKAFACDAASPEGMTALFKAVDGDLGEPDIAVYNPSARVRGPVHEIDPAKVRDALLISSYGAFLMAQEAVKRMLPKSSGTLLFTGASAGVKGFPNSSSFAMGKFALRGLAQALARELHPQGIHVGHFVIDGGIASSYGTKEDDSTLSPDAIAETYWHFVNQHRSAWAWEIELRPWVEKF